MFATFVTVIMQGKSCNRGGHKREESNERQEGVEHEQKVAKFINSKIKYCGPIQSLQHRTTQSGGKKGNPNQAWETQHITVIKR